MEDLGGIALSDRTREIICAEEPLPFIHTSISDSAFWSPSVIRRSSTNSLEFASITTFVVRIVESTPLLCTVSSVKRNFLRFQYLSPGSKSAVPFRFPLRNAFPRSARWHFFLHGTYGYRRAGCRCSRRCGYRSPLQSTSAPSAT